VIAGGSGRFLSQKYSTRKTGGKYVLAQKDEIIFFDALGKIRYHYGRAAFNCVSGMGIDVHGKLLYASYACAASASAFVDGAERRDFRLYVYDGV